MSGFGACSIAAAPPLSLFLFQLWSEGLTSPGGWKDGDAGMCRRNAYWGENAYWGGNPATSSSDDHADTGGNDGKADA